MQSQNSVMVVKASNPATRWQDLRGARLGYINTYCTTSYFAPSILIAREGLPLTTFFKAGPVPAWHGQIDAVVDGSIDVTMVYEDVWLARAANAARTKIIARVDGLPTPAFIVRSDIGPFASKLKDALLTSPPPTGSGLLYAGVADYQDARMQHFFGELETIPALAPANSQDAAQRTQRIANSSDLSCSPALRTAASVTARHSRSNFRRRRNPCRQPKCRRNFNH